MTTGTAQAAVEPDAFASLVQKMEAERDRLPDFSTLAVFTYKGALTTQMVPTPFSRTALPQMLSALFGPRKQDTVFSLTATPEGDFLILDVALHASLFGGSGVSSGNDGIPAPHTLPHWSCLYLHEASPDRTGAEVSGALSTLCERLAAARVPVLNVCTLARNFMLMREEVSQVALDTLRSAVEEGANHDGQAADGAGAGQILDGPPQKRQHVGASGHVASALSGGSGVRIVVTPARVSITVATISVADLKKCAHAILALFVLPQGGARPTFQHLFEMGGEVSLAFEDAALRSLHDTEPASAAALEEAIAPTVVRGWRVLDVTAPAGGDSVGILSAVTVPLASVPLLNVSTLEHSYVLVQEADLDVALARLKTSFDVIDAS